MKKKFEDYLENIFMEQEPMVLDDDLPEAFDGWMSELDVEQVIHYAELWGDTLIAEKNKSLHAIFTDCQKIVDTMDETLKIK